MCPRNTVLPFVDLAKITVVAGHGGNGCRSFYRDKYTQPGIPDGGDGGRGGDVILVADPQVHTLLDCQYQRQYTAGRGAHGSGKGKRGADGEDRLVPVPVGTVVKEATTGAALGDLTVAGERLVVARGGARGIGNQRTRRQPITHGKPGETKRLILELKLLADVGIIGLPNAGKSTLISNISRATPKIASYPFTTLSPVLGVVEGDDHAFVCADIPGLIEGSHAGKGLGDRFLRHIERTKVLIHLLDMSGSEGRNPLESYDTINRELKAYHPALVEKPQILAANKMDLEGAKANLDSFRRKVKQAVYPISAKHGAGLEALVAAVWERLCHPTRGSS